MNALNKDGIELGSPDPLYVFPALSIALAGKQSRRRNRLDSESGLKVTRKLADTFFSSKTDITKKISTEVPRSFEM